MYFVKENFKQKNVSFKAGAAFSGKEKDKDGKEVIFDAKEMKHLKDAGLIMLQADADAGQLAEMEKKIAAAKLELSALEAKCKPLREQLQASGQKHGAQK